MAKKRRVEPDSDGFIGRSMARGKMKWVLIILISAIGITAISVTAASYKTVETNHYGLMRNTFTKELDETVYVPGAYWTNPFIEVILFPSTWQTIELSDQENSTYKGLKATSRDGFTVELECSFQYKLKKDNLVELYKDFGTAYEDFFVREARSVLRDMISLYNATEFFTIRSLIDLKMQEAMKNQSDLFQSDIGEFQLREIDLPDDVEDSMHEIFLLQQEILKEQLKYEAAIIEAKRLIVNAQAQKNVTIINAEATAEALNITVTAEGIALFNLANQTGFNSTELLIYMWIKAIENSDDAYLIIGEDTPTILDL